MKSDMLTILLVRHGMTKNNTEGRFCGITDYVLT
ncbi:MAG: histidine phosphatase family protein, partial [Lachnospiraceae bacterium]|nr:histidine phosphatase family protein [Lachnospiraceae bacterium]